MKKQPLLIKTFLSCALFFIFTLGVVLAIFNYSMINYSENEIGESNISKLKILSGINDVLIYSVEEDALNLSLDKDISKYFSSISSQNSDALIENALQYNTIIVKLNGIVNSNERIQSIYIYSNDTKRIISSKSGVDTIDNFYDTDWLKYYKEDNYNSFWLKTRVPINKNISNASSLRQDNSNVITFVFPLSKYTSDFKGAIVINLYENKFSNLLNDNNFNKAGYVSVVSKDGTIISHIDKSLIGKSALDIKAMKNFLSDNKTEGYFISNINSKKQLIAYYKSDINNWCYIGVYPLNTLESKANNLRFYIFISIFLLMITGVCVYYFATKRLFSPVNALIQDIKRHKGLDFNENEDEFAILSKAFDTIIKSENELSNSFQKSRKNIQKSYLFNLLHGSNEDMSAAGLSEEIFPHEDFICILLSIDKYKDFRKSFSDEQGYYIETLILNICEQIFNEPYKCSGVILDRGKIAFIINTKISTYTDTIQEIKAKILMIQSEISKVLDFTVSFGIGSKCSSKLELTNSYVEAQEALNYKFIYGYNSVINCNDISGKSRGYFFPYAFEEHIINNINVFSKEGITSEINATVDKIKDDPNSSYDTALLFFTQLTGIIVRHLLKLNIRIDDIFGNDFNMYNYLNEIETIDDMKFWILDIIMKIIDYLSSLKSSSDNYIDTIMNYINENYKRDIDINRMAESIGISYTHLRRIFVNVTGENLVTYINNMRITEAKRLLTETSTSIVNIALSLGYNNDQSFNRFFKKYEGITAGEYRRNNRDTGLKQ